MNSQDLTRVNYLYAGILDTQAIIRQTDIKVGFLMLVSVFPSLHLADIIAQYQKQSFTIISLMFLALTVIFWALGFFFLYKTLCPIEPSNSTLPSDFKSGLFFGPKSVSPEYSHLFSNKIEISSENISSIHTKLPQSLPELEKELIGEKVKLNAIRDIKLYRAKYALLFFIFWFALGTISYANTLIAW